MATTTAPPSIKTISFPILAAAAPDCRPGWPVVVVAALTPAVPLGVGAAEYGAGTTVTAVTVLWLPSGRVVVCRIVEVMEREDAGLDDGAAVVAAPEAPADEGERVTKPPPTVLTMVTPDTSVVDTTDPGASGEGERVTTPPLTVLTMVTPDPSVVVTTDPGAVATTVAVETPPAADPAALDAATLD